MFHVVLFEPEIPPNTGNIIRLCANTGVHLHLIEPMGFVMDDARLRRAGLDYHEWASVEQHPSWDAFISRQAHDRVFALTTKAKQSHCAASYQRGDIFVFGPESRGLPRHVLDHCGEGKCLRLPMRDESRSLNVSNAVAVVVYEAWRQLGFAGASE